MNSISFIGNDRIYDKDASMKQVRNPKNSFVFLTKFLGALKNDQQVFEISKKYYEEYIYQLDPIHGTVIFELEKFKLNKANEKILLRVEEITGMILKSAKKYAEQKAEIPNIKDCVITVPTNWSLKQRIALVQSARIAGLIPISLIHDNTAAALHYGLNFLNNNNNNTLTKNVIFYNMGSTNIQASLVQFSFTNNTIKLDNQKIIPVVSVLADYGISDVGGYAYDLKIADYFAEQIDVSQPNQPTFKENRKGMVKLLKESNKVKEILSANKETQFFSEGLLDGNDFKSFITRSKFEEITSNLTQNVLIPVHKVLQMSNKTKEDIEIVELIGGGVRIPKVQQILGDFFGQNKTGFHLNGDESMALGAAFLAANYSSSFRVKRVQLNDGYNFDIKMKIINLNPEDGDDFSKETVLFGYKKRFGSKKVINFKHDKDIQLNIFTEDYEGNTMQLVKYNITNISSVFQNKKYQEFAPMKISLHFELGSIRVIDLSDVEASLNITQKLENDKVKSKIQNFDVDIYEMYPFYNPLNQTEVEKSQKKLERFDKFQEQIKMVEKQKNTFESLIYQIKEHSTDKSFLKYSDGKDIQKAVELAEENSQWLESDDVNYAGIEDFKKRYQDMENIINPIKFRKSEHEKRVKGYNEATKQINSFQENTDKLEKTHPWISKDEKSKLNKLIQSTKVWMQQVQEKQKTLKLYENPAFILQEVNEKVSEIKKEYDRIKAIKKPTAIKPNVDNKKDQQTQQQNNQQKKNEKKQGKKEDL
ncbi:hypothetical protein IMG5_073090 [Ichthyophthirius multifiliis]|uniref:Uncharacterized protein n=1 Tax=Ichthyophthirius multifiliis TaxID=5932 RepID=G0QPY7_ICHMU|nr:hypothetical protein IMG5_073090 [Ichthyophthirius multifiliis]EGR32714.1 hypothetical protein IMG5_073090 [Ichthyophthirius multifiliis]|eukprot:XP_004036700.1 hypothetical protein IMG5_073090 [Ichthyophthirius multifiliis]